MSFDPAVYRDDFPLLRGRTQHGPVIYFDNAATSLKPTPVIAAINAYLTDYSGNIHRGQHALGAALGRRAAFAA